jgi:hypothetical protein
MAAAKSKPTSSSRARQLYIETLIKTDMERVWQASQDPQEHVRWDLRFTRITPGPLDADGNRTFRYELQLPGILLEGTGVSVGERRRPDGSGTSALRFVADDSRSPLQEGSGYWRYVATADGVRFLTGYDYRPWGGQVGEAVDAVVGRPLVGWLTARSFDALRIWLETGTPPEETHRRGAVDIASRAALVTATTLVGRRLGGLSGVAAGAAIGAVLARLIPTPDSVPSAGRCLRSAPDPTSATAPSTLDSLRRPA